jgi:hypothetical protein
MSSSARRDTAVPVILICARKFALFHPRMSRLIAFIVLHSHVCGSYHQARKRLARALPRMVGILDYCKVSVKPLFLQSCHMLGIGHYEAIRKELVRLMRKERERRKLSNYTVSQRSGVSESMLSLVERGLRNPTVELMLRIADGIGANLPALIQKATLTVVRQGGGTSA